MEERLLPGPDGDEVADRLEARGEAPPHEGVVRGQIVHDPDDRPLHSYFPTTLSAETRSAGMRVLPDEVWTSAPRSPRRSLRTS